MQARPGAYLDILKDGTCLLPVFNNVVILPEQLLHLGGRELVDDGEEALQQALLALLYLSMKGMREGHEFVGVFEEA